MRTEFPRFRSPIVQVSALLLCTVLAGCSSDARRVEMPWSVPVASNNQANSSDFTGSISSSKPSTFAEIKSQPLPPVASAEPSYSPAPVYKSSAPAAAPYAAAKTVEPKQVAHASGDVFVESGDTLYAIARRNNVPVGKLMAANGLKSANDIKAGQRLVLPGAQHAVTTPKAERAFAAAAPAAQHVPGQHVVQPGETMSSISRQYNIAPGDIARANSFGAKDSMKTGQALVIPDARQKSTITARTETSTAEPVQTPVKEKTVRVIPMTRTDAVEKTAEAPKAEKPVEVAKTEEPETKAEKAEITASLPNPGAMSSTEFRWPVQGRVVENFGAQQGGGRNDGINIAVPAGTPIKAAENGVVAYAGSELKGYGKLILIRHDNDYVTAYAHNSDISVKRGDKVTRGQIIGKAGQTGNVAQPQLHFEIRKGSSPVDPMSHLSNG